MVKIGNFMLTSVENKFKWISTFFTFELCPVEKGLNWRLTFAFL